MRSLLLLALIPTVLGMPFQQFLPVFQKDVLDVSASALGLMFTAVGVGSLIGSLSVAYVPEHRAQAFQLVTGFLFGVALVGFAVSTTLPMALLTLAAVGLTSQAYFVMNNVLLMASTDREYYGRMMSIYMLTWSVQPVAVYPMGIIIDEIGMPITQAAVGAILAVFVAIVIVFRRPGRPKPVPA